MDDLMSEMYENSLWSKFGLFHKSALVEFSYDYTSEEKTVVRYRRIFLSDRENPSSGLGPDECREKYRFWPRTILDICQLVYNKLEHETNCSNSLPVLNQVCIVLLWYANGEYPKNNGTFTS